jgi:3-oxoacyl-[acyl-carrier-protein] synthase-3
MIKSAQAVMDGVGWRWEMVDAMVPHQANMRILDAVATQVGLPMDRVVSTIGETGNTAAASVPIALAVAAAHGRIKSGNRLLLCGFGAGAAWGSAALTWPAIDGCVDPLA